MQPNADEPVVYRTPHTPLLPTAQSPRAPWLHAATMTAAKFKQSSRFKTEKALEQMSCQVHSLIGTSACWLLSGLICCKLCSEVSMHTSCVTDKQAEPVMSGRSTERATPLSQRLALQQRVVQQPVAVRQQMKLETQAQVMLLTHSTAKAAVPDQQTECVCPEHSRRPVYACRYACYRSTELRSLELQCRCCHSSLWRTQASVHLSVLKVK